MRQNDKTTPHFNKVRTENIPPSVATTGRTTKTTFFFSDIFISLLDFRVPPSVWEKNMYGGATKRFIWVYGIRVSKKKKGKKMNNRTKKQKN